VKEARNSLAILLATLPPIFSHYNSEGNEIGSGRESERVVEGLKGKMTGSVAQRMKELTRTIPIKYIDCPMGRTFLENP